MSIKDHLRSLADKELPPEPEAEPELEPASEKAAPAPISMGAIKHSLVTISADAKEGKGFVVDGEGKIVTNYHLVNAAKRLKVVMLSGDIFLGKVIRSDESRDLALIQIPFKTPQHLKLGEAGAVDVGEHVFVLAGPAGTSEELSKAIINGLRSMGGVAVLQLDRAIDPAYSGSPFVTRQGAVIGIASYRMGEREENMGFGVSVKELKPFISGQ